MTLLALGYGHWIALLSIVDNATDSREVPLIECDGTAQAIERRAIRRQHLPTSHGRSAGNRYPNHPGLPGLSAFCRRR